jgi:hypothetical protein
MIGSPKNTKGYKLWDINAQKVVFSGDVLFEEVKLSTQICELEDNLTIESCKTHKVLRRLTVKMLTSSKA